MVIERESASGRKLWLLGFDDASECERLCEALLWQSGHVPEGARGRYETAVARLSSRLLEGCGLGSRPYESLLFDDEVGALLLGLAHIESWRLSLAAGREGKGSEGGKDHGPVQLDLAARLAWASAGVELSGGAERGPGPVATAEKPARAEIEAEDAGEVFRRARLQRAGTPRAGGGPRR